MQEEEKNYLQKLAKGETIYLEDNKCCCKKNGNHYNVTLQSGEYEVSREEIEDIIHKVLNKKISLDELDNNLKNKKLENGELLNLKKYNCFCKKNEDYYIILLGAERYKVFQKDIMRDLLSEQKTLDEVKEILKKTDKIETENQYKVGYSDFQWKIVKDSGRDKFKIKDVRVSNKGNDTCIVKFVYPNEGATEGRYDVTISRSDNVIITDYPLSKKLNIQKNLDKKEQEKFFELLKENNKQNELIELLQGKAIGGSKHGDSINYNSENEDEEPHDTLPDDMFERLNDLNSNNLIYNGKVEGDNYCFNSFGLPLSINKDKTLNVLDNNHQSTFSKTINGDDFSNLVDSIKQNDIDMFIQSAFMLDKNSTIETLPADQACQYYTYNDYTPKNCNYSYSDNFYNSINTYNSNSTYYTNDYNYF